MKPVCVATMTSVVTLCGVFCAAISILNVAPGVASLSPEFFSNIDVLCLNETEVLNA